MRRSAAAVDGWISEVMAAYLARPDLDDVLPKATPRPGTDAEALRREARTLNGKRDQLARLLMQEVLTERGVRQERVRIDQRLAAITAELTASDEPDPVAEFRAAPADPDERLRWCEAMWASLPLPRKRAIIRKLVRVTILPATRKGSRFDPASVRIEPIRYL